MNGDSTPSGKFITLEGIDGSGKTTAKRYITEIFHKHAIPFIETREPGGTPLAEEMRNLLLNNECNEEITIEAELLLIYAARMQHVREKIIPTLARGDWVLCDRFTDATYAYQGGGAGMDMATIAQLESLFKELPQPDVTLVFDLPVSVAIERIHKRGVKDRFDRQSAAFFERVRQVYLQRAEQDKQRYCIIPHASAQQTQQYIQQKIIPFIS